MKINDNGIPPPAMTEAEFQNAVEVFELLFQWDQEANSRRDAAQIEALEPDCSSKSSAIYSKLTLRSKDEA